jgi:ankyrin repeat protein
MTIHKSLNKNELRRLPKWKSDAILFDYIKNGSLKKIKLALNLGMSPDIILDYAIKSGNLLSVIFTLNHDKISKPHVGVRAGITAIMYNKFNILKFLVDNNWIGYDYENRSLLTVSASEGRLDMVDFLLKDPQDRFHPAFDNHQAIIESSRIGNYKVVERLLQDKNVDPTFTFNKAIKKSAEFGHKNIFELLLKDKRVFNTLMESEVKHYRKTLNESIAKLRKHKLEEILS